MRKFLLPVINLINIVLVSITFGLASKTAVIDQAFQDRPCGSFYQIAWGHPGSASTLGIVGFFLFVFAVAITVFAFLPVKLRKFATAFGGAMYIGAGILFLLSPAYAQWTIVEPKLTGALIASAVLVFIAGLFTLIMSLIEFLTPDAE